MSSSTHPAQHGSLAAASSLATTVVPSPMLNFDHMACHYLGSIAATSATLASGTLSLGFSPDDFESTVPFQLSRADMPGRIRRA